MVHDALTRFLDEAAAGVGVHIPPPDPASAPGARSLAAEKYHRKLSVDDLLYMYRFMITSRKLDDREIFLQRQGQAWFTTSTAGREAVLAAAGMVLRPTDPLWIYYRDRTLCLMRGVTERDRLLQTIAAAADPASGGRQMPEHWGEPGKAIMIPASPTGCQDLPAVGMAEALTRTRALIGQGRYPADSIVYVSHGEDTTAEGEFYEALRAAINVRAPLILHVMDDGYGISVPVSEQVPGGDILALFRGWPRLSVLENDGNSVRASYDNFTRAANLCRSGQGPVLLRSKVLRLYSHSSTDDMRKYRPLSDVTIEFEERDPILRFAQELVAYGIATPQDLREIHRQIEEKILRVVDEILPLPKTDVSRFLTNVYAYDPQKAQADYAAAVQGRKCAHAGETMVLADAINASLAEIMDLLPRAVMWGEDVADLSREYLQRHPELEGKGGVFGVTKGLQRRFGPDRVMNSPLAEATIIGRAAGYSLQGFLPIVEIQFRDYLNPAWQQLTDQVATLCWRSNGNFTCPMIVRIACGGYLGGAGALWHSESGHGPLLYYPGIRLCIPSNTEDAAALLRAAAFCGDPVLYLEPKARSRMRDEFTERRYPDFDSVLWPGKSRRYGDGKDLAILTFGATTALCQRAVKTLESQGVNARLLDLCWLNPLDEEAIRSSADDCGAVLIVDEDRRSGGVGAVIADVIYRDRDLRRRVDVERVTAKDCRVAYGPVGERAVLPQVDDIIRTAREMVKSRR